MPQPSAASSTDVDANLQLACSHPSSLTTYLQGLLGVCPTAAAVIGLHGLGEMCHIRTVDLACM